MSVWIRVRLVKRSQRNPRGKTYGVTYRVCGRMYPQQAAGTFKTEKEARTRRDLVAGWIAQGLDPKDELAKLRLVKTRRTFKEWGELWLASRIDLSPGAHETYRRRLNAIYPTLSKADPLTFTTLDAQEWIGKHSHLSPTTVSHYVRAIRLVFDYTGMSENPWRARSVKLPHKPRKDVNTTTAEQVIAILEQVPARAVLPIAVLEQEGSRISETLALAFGDFDEVGRRLRFRGETTKTSQAR